MTTENQKISSSSPQLSRANPLGSSPQLKQKKPLSASSPVLSRARTPPPRETGNTDALQFRRCPNGKAVEIRVSQDGDVNNFGWAAGTFQREGYNPSDADAMDTLMQAGWCEVGDLKYDDERGGMTPADLYKDDVLVFRNSRGPTERIARYEGENAFSYADMNGIVHRESRAEFATSHADALKCGATIMRETNTHRHRMLAESVRPLVTELRGMDSSSRRMSSWSPKLSRAVADCVFNQFGLYANAHLDKTNPPRDNILFPKEKFMEQFQDDVKKLHAEDRLTPQEVEKYADEIYAHRKCKDVWHGYVLVCRICAQSTVAKRFSRRMENKENLRRMK